MVSGGAPLNPDIGSFFLALGVNLLQGYGQTEAGPVISCNSPARIKIETVGPPLDGVDVRIAEDGEILVAGDNVMKGYWNDPAASARAIQDDWLHTGDVGLIDADGYIRITDRKRDFIKSSGGEMISPARVEGYLTLEPEIAQAMAFGDRRPYLVAVLVPDAEFVAGFAGQEGPAAPDDPRIAKALAAAVARVNGQLSPVERVRRFVIATEPFTIANGQMTPTLKIRRHVIREAYNAQRSTRSMTARASPPEREGRKQVMPQLSQIDRIFEDAVGCGDAPGVVATAATRKGVVYEGALGRRALPDGAGMTGDTVFWIASMTKASPRRRRCSLSNRGNCRSTGRWPTCCPNSPRRRCSKVSTPPASRGCGRRGGRSHCATC